MMKIRELRRWTSSHIVAGNWIPVDMPVVQGNTGALVLSCWLVGQRWQLILLTLLLPALLAHDLAQWLASSARGQTPPPQLQANASFTFICKGNWWFQISICDLKQGWYDDCSVSEKFLLQWSHPRLPQVCIHWNQYEAGSENQRRHWGCRVTQHGGKYISFCGATGTHLLITCCDFWDNKRCSGEYEAVFLEVAWLLLQREFVIGNGEVPVVWGILSSSKFKESNWLVLEAGADTDASFAQSCPCIMGHFPVWTAHCLFVFPLLLLWAHQFWFGEFYLP